MDTPAEEGETPQDIDMTTSERVRFFFYLHIIHYEQSRNVTTVLQ